MSEGEHQKPGTVPQRFKSRGGFAAEYEFYNGRENCWVGAKSHHIRKRLKERDWPWCPKGLPEESWERAYGVLDDDPLLRRIGDPAYDLIDDPAFIPDAYIPVPEHEVDAELVEEIESHNGLARQVKSQPVLVVETTGAKLVFYEPDDRLGRATEKLRTSTDQLVSEVAVSVTSKAFAAGANVAAECEYLAEQLRAAAVKSIVEGLGVSTVEAEGEETK